MHLLLEYTLADDYLERRAALHDDHLGLARAAHERGELCSAGRCPMPTTGAARLDGAARGRGGLRRAGPLVVHGLVTDWTVREWNVVIG